MEYAEKYVAMDLNRYTKLPTPLQERAWVLQEILLSTRTLAYSTSGVSWRCQSDDVEHGHSLQYRLPYRLPIFTDGFDAIKDWNELMLSDPHTDFTPAINYQKMLSWTALLNTYLSMKLSYESDRLFAIKGIITTLERRAGLKFIAELCITFLPFSLLWAFVSDSAMWGSPYTSWRSSLELSPSWSNSIRGGSLYVGPRDPEKWLNHTRSLTTVSSGSGAGPTLRILGKYYGPVQLGNGATVPSVMELGWRIFRKLTVVVRWDFEIKGDVEVVFVLLITGREQNSADAHGLVLTKDYHETAAWERIGVFQTAPRFMTMISTNFRKEGEFLVR
ncbi:hypothetical protein K491DRAFT_711329 [Lophiostoma macrostomum CBS 122681]|uniref:Heterokaryon incompatibility domain-containing protein n=1 Tax=Lophiostoma macrostomum CBS 122681 TaxID=1314788 RepID=A0A6A6TQ55_9PLEO|nr:hypothetical protein K491DRAFT_711329 [Lophiostoma macrostomum CBS 122681]